jgi:hypothetical protein
MAGKENTKDVRRYRRLCFLRDSGFKRNIFHLKIFFADILQFKTECSFFILFWNITPCSPLKVSRRFGGTCRLHRQGKKTSKGRNQNGVLGSCFFLVWLIFRS